MTGKQKCKMLSIAAVLLSVIAGAYGTLLYQTICPCMNDGSRLQLVKWLAGSRCGQSTSLFAPTDVDFTKRDVPSWLQVWNVPIVDKQLCGETTRIFTLNSV